MSLITNPSGSVYLAKTRGVPPQGKFYTTDANLIRQGLLDVAHQFVSGCELPLTASHGLLVSGTFVAGAFSSSGAIVFSFDPGTGVQSIGLGRDPVDPYWPALLFDSTANGASITQSISTDGADMIVRADNRLDVLTEDGEGALRVQKDLLEIGPFNDLGGAFGTLGHKVRLRFRDRHVDDSGDASYHSIENVNLGNGESLINVRSDLGDCAHFVNDQNGIAFGPFIDDIDRAGSGFIGEGSNGLEVRALNRLDLVAGYGSGVPGKIIVDSDSIRIFNGSTAADTTLELYGEFDGYTGVGSGQVGQRFINHTDDANGSGSPSTVVLVEAHLGSMTGTSDFDGEFSIHVSKDGSGGDQGPRFRVVPDGIQLKRGAADGEDVVFTMNHGGTVDTHIRSAGSIVVAGKDVSYSDANFIVDPSFARNIEQFPGQTYYWYNRGEGWCWWDVPDTEGPIIEQNTLEVVDPFSGNQATKVTFSDVGGPIRRVNDYIGEEEGLIVGETYDFSVYLMPSGSSGTLDMALRPNGQTFSGPDVFHLSASLPGGVWTQVTASLTHTGGNWEFWVGSDAPDDVNFVYTTGTFYVYGMELVGKSSHTGVEVDGPLTGGMEVTGDVRVSGSTNGVVLADANGVRWRVTVATDGSLVTSVV